jgi:hypothetical protein
MAALLEIPDRIDLADDIVGAAFDYRMPDKHEDGDSAIRMDRGPRYVGLSRAPTQDTLAILIFPFSVPIGLGFGADRLSGSSLPSNAGLDRAHIGRDPPQHRWPWPSS